MSSSLTSCSCDFTPDSKTLVLGFKGSVGIKRLHDVLEVTTAQLVLLVQSYNCLFRVSAAGIKLQLLKDYNWLKD
ncbi:hypothetical protein Tco_0076623 [Tanacetum coccineum]